MNFFEKIFGVKKEVKEVKPELKKTEDFTTEEQKWFDAGEKNKEEEVDKESKKKGPYREPGDFTEAEEEEWYRKKEKN